MNLGLSLSSLLKKFILIDFRNVRINYIIGEVDQENSGYVCALFTVLQFIVKVFLQ